ncbi:hypothetical protein Csa_016838 [Cucumis sativus]|nr:hypothetical protein Csa_016838 [Cucumis sativus]
MLEDFKDIHEYKIWFSSQTKFNTIMKQPTNKSWSTLMEGLWVIRTRQKVDNAFNCRLKRMLCRIYILTTLLSQN